MVVRKDYVEGTPEEEVYFVITLAARYKMN